MPSGGTASVRYPQGPVLEVLQRYLLSQIDVTRSNTVGGKTPSAMLSSVGVQLMDVEGAPPRNAIASTGVTAYDHEITKGVVLPELLGRQP